MTDAEHAEAVKDACEQLNRVIGDAWGIGGLRVEVEVETMVRLCIEHGRPIVLVRVSKQL